MSEELKIGYNKGVVTIRLEIPSTAMKDSPERKLLLEYLKRSDGTQWPAGEYYSWRDRAKALLSEGE